MGSTTNFILYLSSEAILILGVSFPFFLLDPIPNCFKA
ncbi:hypothetical protein PRO82_001354 [Candidatus Protochlamydia amoebophila]|nr:hypothetical protein [Candidatus Protochlamydia amoebophila]